MSYASAQFLTSRVGRPGRVTNLVTRPSLALAERLAAAAVENAPIASAFSRNRSLRRTAKKQALENVLQQVAVDGSAHPANAL